MEQITESGKNANSSRIVPVLEQGHKIPIVPGDDTMGINANRFEYYSSKSLPDETTQNLYNEVEPGVVKIRTRAGTGSGFVVSDEYILTAAHVINPTGAPDKESVFPIAIYTADKQLLTGQVDTKNIDHAHDVALVTIISSHKPLRSLKINESPSQSDKESAWLLGHPLGLARTYVSRCKYKNINTGYSAAKEVLQQHESSGTLTYNEARSITNDLANAFQNETNKKNRPMHRSYWLYDGISEYGNSGGPVINKKGEVIAISSMSIMFEKDHQKTSLLEGFIPIKHVVPLLKKEGVTF